MRKNPWLEFKERTRLSSFIVVLQEFAVLQKTIIDCFVLLLWPLERFIIFINLNVGQLSTKIRVRQYLINFVLDLLMVPARAFLITNAAYRSYFINVSTSHYHVSD